MEDSLTEELKIVNHHWVKLIFSTGNSTREFLEKELAIIHHVF